jgi:hypothetical protein
MLLNVEGCGDLVLLCNEISGRERKTILIPVQIFAFAFIASYLIFVAAELHRRNHRSWQAIVECLSPGLGDTDGRWTRFRDAGVMMQMTDFAERNGFIDATYLREFRSAALGIRFAALKALIRISA